MDELKRPCGKRQDPAVTDSQHGRILQFIVEQTHHMSLAVFVKRGRRFVEKDPARFVQQKPRKGEAFLFAERKLFVPTVHLVELADEITKIAPLECLSDRGSEKASGGLG